MLYGITNNSAGEIFVLGRCTTLRSRGNKVLKLNKSFLFKSHIK